MNKTKFIIISVLVSLIKISDTNAQIPVEVFAGNKKASFDAMFFKYFKNKNAENSKVLFFSRSRSTIDYKMTTTTNLPTFGLTEAISYNHPKLKGFAPVFVTQILNKGVFPKAGVQFAHIKKEVSIFTWLVCETLEKPNLDYFLLFRYIPKLFEKINLFSQVESVNAFPTVSTDNYSFTQRLRLGLSIKSYQFGAGADFNQTGNTTFAKTYNVGGFIRHEF